MSAYASRIERLRALFDEAEIDGMLISQPESRFYLSGYTGHDLPPRDSAGYLMIGKSGARLLTDPRTSEQAEKKEMSRTELKKRKEGNKQGWEESKLREAERQRKRRKERASM